MNKFRKASLISALVAAAYGVPVASYGANGVIFNQTGGGGGAGAVFVSQFNWEAGNVVLVNASNQFGAPATGGSTSTTLTYAKDGTHMIGQTIMAGMVGDALATGAGAIRVFTYQFDIPVNIGETTNNLFGPGTFNTLAVSTPTGPIVGGTFKMYVDEIIPAGGRPDQVTGLLFGDTANTGQSLILTGTAYIRQPNFTVTQTASDLVTAPLSSTGGANAGITTTTMSGSGEILIDVTTASSNYFASDITSFVINLAFPNTADANTGFGLNAAMPSGVNAQGSVVGYTPVNFGNGKNDFYCADPGVDSVSGDPLPVKPCDLQFGTNSSTFFLHNVPEPGALALLGLGISMMGVAVRRRKVTA